MKKILLATTMLVGTAGFAAAEAVTVSGSARAVSCMTASRHLGRNLLLFPYPRGVHRFRAKPTAACRSGFSVRADQQGGNNNDAGADADGDSNGDSTVFISGAFGKMTFGDVSGAADALVGQVSGVGYGPNDALQEIGFVGTDKTAV